MSASAGKVMPRPMDDYNSATEYKILDIVTYNDRPYMAKQTTQGNLPTNTTYWMLLLDFPTEVDNVPTQNSQNLVYSGGVYSALGAKQNTLTFDNSPTENSDNPVKSGGVYTALAGKQDTLTFDNTPTQNSGNPVTSGGVYTALQGIGGHTIKDENTTYTDRKNLKFVGFGVEDDATNNATVIKKYSGTVCTWANGTDAEIAEMLRAHYQGELNIYDYWSVGDERVIHMDAIAQTTDYSSVAARDITLILVNKGGKYLASDPSQECAFVVGFKQCIATNLVIIKNISTTYKWENCQARTWLNESVRNAIPEAMRNLFKKHINKCTDYQSNITNVEDYLECPARVEVDGTTASPYKSEGSQFEYYQTIANRIKKINASDTFGQLYYTRTVDTSSTNNFWGIDYQGNTLSRQGNTNFSLTAQGCI